MFRTAFLSLLLLTTGLAAPSPITRQTISCSNQCIPVPNLPCPSTCLTRPCTFRIGPFIRIRGTSCRARPSPTPSTTPIPAPSRTPTPTPTPSTTPAPAITQCSFDVASDLKFSCDCTDAAGGNTVAEVDFGARFSGTNRSSRSCFESCLAGLSIPACEISLDQSRFEEQVDDNFHFCCYSCDAEVRSGVCVPFEG